MPAGTPMDVEMASPSPMTIQSLSLSPRRNPTAKPPVFHQGNIFAGNGNQEARCWDPEKDFELDSDDDDIPAGCPSPTRMIKSSRKNPFLAKGRPQLHAQKSMPVTHRLQSKQSQALQQQGKTIGVAASTPDLQGAALRNKPSTATLGERSNSPTRRMVTKMPSTVNLKSNGDAASAQQPSLSRKPSKKDSNDTPQHDSSQQSSAPSSATAAKLGKNNIRGRTLVELQQERAANINNINGGRPLSAVYMSDLPSHMHHQIAAGNTSPVRAFREHAAAANRGYISSAGDVAVWDPEKDDMPSPFLVKKKQVGGGMGLVGGLRGVERSA
jgi:hypothetical protein